MKRTLLIFTTLLLFVTLTCASFAAGTPVIAVGSAQTEAGKTVSVDITLSNNPGIRGFQFEIGYDTSRMTLKEATVSKDIGGLPSISGNMIGWVNTDVFSADGTIATLTFDVLEGASAGDADVTLTVKTVADANNAALQVTSKSGVITVKKLVCEHSWDAGKVTKAATCKEEGVKELTCTLCGEKKTETIAKDASNHADYGTEVKNAKAATETAKGYTGDTVCKGCGAVIEKGKDIPPIPHKHTLTKTEAKAATCNEAGNVEYYTCSGCKKIFSDAAGTKEITSVTVPAKGHTFGEWKVEKEATKTEEGLKSRTCTVCKYKDTQKIDKIKGDEEPSEKDKEPCKPTEKVKEPCKPTEKVKGPCKPTEKTKDPVKKNCEPKPTKKCVTDLKSDSGKDTGDNSILVVVTGVIALAGAAFVISKKKKA